MNFGLTDLESNIKASIEGIITKAGYELYDVIYEKEDNENYLRIVINNPKETTSADDCEKVNNLITDLLDEKNFIKQQYYLEVSSIGLEKRIRTKETLKSEINKILRITLKNREIIGELEDFTDTELTVYVPTNKKTKDVKIEFKDIIKINEYFDINERKV